MHLGLTLPRDAQRAADACTAAAEHNDARAVAQKLVGVLRLED